MSDSSEGDSEGGEGSGRVASVVAEGSAEVDRPGAAEHADRQVAKARHDVWAGAGPKLGSVLGEVMSRTQCREGFPVQTANGLVQRVADPLTVPVAGVACDC
jgi:hypothetical protein